MLLNPVNACIVYSMWKINKYKSIDIDGVLLSYKVKGKGMPVLFLHGWGVDHAIWEHQFEKAVLQKRNKYQRIYFDLPGMGKSITNHKIHNSDDMLAIVSKFADFMIGEKHFLLAGESYGGYLARGLLLKKEKQIDGLLLLCPLMFPGWRAGRHADHVVLEIDRDFINSLPQDKAQGFKELSVVQTKKTYRDYCRDINVSVAPGNGHFLAEELDGAFEQDINKNPLIYKKPALVLAGRQDTEVGFEDQYDLFRNFPRASILILDKSGHNLQIEQKKLFKAAVLDWLDRIE
jgi:pimeloyl-ACP methyl ester carboxylesterase